MRKIYLALLLMLIHFDDKIGVTLRQGAIKLIANHGDTRANLTQRQFHFTNQQCQIYIC